MDDTVIELRDPVDGDAEVHFAYPPVAEIVRMYGSGISKDLPKADLDRSKRWLAWFRDHPFAKIIIYDGNPVGHVRLHGLNKADQNARLSIGLFCGGIFEPRDWTPSGAPNA